MMVVAPLLVSCSVSRQVVDPMVLKQQDAMHTWQAPDSTVSQRWHAVMTLLSPGMTRAQIRKLLGEPTQPFREHGLIIGRGPYESWGLEYRFSDGGVHLHMDGWQSNSLQDQWIFRSASYVGLSRAIPVRSKADDEIEVKIETVEPTTGRIVPPSAGASGGQ